MEKSKRADGGWGGTISLNYIPVYEYTCTACILNQLVQHTRKSQGCKC